MVDEVTTWFLGSWGGYSKFREFEESTFRGFDNSWTYGPVELFACGLFKLGVFSYLGGVICKKTLFSVKGGEKRALDVFLLDSVGVERRRGYSCSVKFWVKRSTSVLKSG